MGFDEYIKEYGLQRSEGVLLRYLSQLYKIMNHTVPEAHHDDEYRESLTFLKTIITQIDSSLIDEWESLANPDSVMKDEPEAETLQIDDKSLRIIVRNACFRIVRLLAQGKLSEAIELLSPNDRNPRKWREHELAEQISQYRESCGAIRTDPDARRGDLFRMSADKEDPTVEQGLLGDNDESEFYLRLIVDVAKTREEGVAHLQLEGVQAITN